MNQSTLFKYAAMASILIGLYFTTFVNYLLFHTLAEIFSIVVASAFFMIAWNSKNYIENHYVLFIGIAYLFIAFLDLLHTLAYKGMPIFTDYDFYANQLWIGARYLESLTLLAAFHFLGSTQTFHPERLFITYTGITTLLILSIFYWNAFPICFIEGEGLTPFKKISEYIICTILLCSMLLLYRKREKFEPYVYRYISISITCTIVSELAFTFYISNYGISNLVGHYFKLFSFYFIYKAIIITGIQNPYDLIFKELYNTNESLKKEIKARRAAEHQKERLIGELKQALAEVKTLSGLLPICSHCKQIRDDQGYWNGVEAFFMERTEAQFSHSICPQCAKKYYPDFKIYDDDGNIIMD